MDTFLFPLEALDKNNQSNGVVVFYFQRGAGFNVCVTSQ